MYLSFSCEIASKLQTINMMAEMLSQFYVGNIYNNIYKSFDKIIKINVQMFTCLLINDIPIYDDISIG